MKTVDVTTVLRAETLGALRELQRVRAAAGAPEITIKELAELLLKTLPKSTAIR